MADNGMQSLASAGGDTLSRRHDCHDLRRHAVTSSRVLGNGL